MGRDALQDGGELHGGGASPPGRTLREESGVLRFSPRSRRRTGEGAAGTDPSLRLANRPLPPRGAERGRIRRAPEATLDHLLVALLRDGTDTAAFLDAHGADRADWARRLDAALPRFAEGTRWPPMDRALGMGGPENRTIRLIKPLPDGVELGDLSKERAREYIEVGEDPAKAFTDLAFATRFPTEPATIGHRLFAEAGIDADTLKAERTAREKGDPEWWRRRPDLIAALREGRETSPLPDFARQRAYAEAATYEARRRGATVVELDDLILALLVSETDLRRLLGDLRIDADATRAAIDALRPHAAQGPFFPETDLIGMRLMALTKQGFSDLLFLRPEGPRDETPSPGLLVLRERGLSPEAIEGRLAELGVVPFR